MATTIPQDDQPYSASVRLELHAAGVVHELSHVGHGAMILRNRATIPAGPAEVVVIVAGVPEVHPVVISPRTDDQDADELFFW